MANWPIVGVLAKLFSSRRFVVAFASIVVYLACLGVPSLAAKADLIFLLIVAVVALLVGSFTIEDVKSAGKQEISEALLAFIQELLDALEKKGAEGEGEETAGG